MIRTEYGSVGLRRKRDPKVIKISIPKGDPPKDDERPSDITIERGWLKKKSTNPDFYAKSVKQSMLIASTQVELEDLSMNTIDPQTNTWRTPEVVMRKRQELSKKIEQMEQGTGMVARRTLTARVNLGKQVSRLKKHVLTKRSAKCSCSRTRWFTIDGGRLQVFKSDGQHAKVRKQYDLSKAKCTNEYSKMPNNPSGEAFLSGKEYRICLQCSERPQGPMYLYPDESDKSKAAKQVKNWERACKMSKYLQSAGDRSALEMVVRRVAGNVMAKGWMCLFDYSKEILSTKKTVKTFAMRLMKVDYSRGWNKFKLTYMKRKNTIELKLQQQEFAAKFLAQRMQSVNSSSAGRPLPAVRKQMMNTIQAKFRHYRQEKIFDRVYALGSQSSSRLQQGKKGSVMDVSFQSQSWKEALMMSLTGEGEKELLKMDTLFKSHKSTYSEINLPLHRGHVNVSDSMTMLSFSEMDQDAEHAQLAKSDWANFVNLDQISSVVVHSERQMAKKGDTPDLHPDVCSGVWFQINGPRVCWNRRVHSYPDHEHPSVEILETLGAADGMEVPRKLASGESCKVLIVEVAVQGSSIPKVRALTKKDGSKDDANKDRGAQLESYMVLNLLGRQFVSDHQFGPTPRYSGAFRAEVPVAWGEGTAASLASLDYSQVSVDIMEVGFEGVDVCLWSGKMPLWKVFKPANYMAYEGLMSGVKHLQSSLDAIRNKGVDPESLEMLIPLSKTLSSGNGAARQKIPLQHATDIIGEQWASGHVELSFNARVEDSRVDKWCVSPELQGCGSVTALYTTHRGSWMNPRPELKGKFIPDNAPSFVELKLRELTFPEKEVEKEAETGKLYQYYIEAKCNGVTITSDPVTRPKKTWAAFIRAPDNKLNFGEKRLYVPIPPGAFCKPAGCKLELALFRTPVNDMPALTFREMLAAKDRPPRASSWPVKVYHATFALEAMQADQVKSSGTFINLAQATEPPAEASTESRGEAEIASLLECQLVLRDRDYVRMCMTERGERKLALCVGDNAMLQCDEPLRYPKDELEFRRRFFPDKDEKGNPTPFDATAAKRGQKSLTLRNPCMSHEWHSSGLLKNQKPGDTVKQKNIPAMAEDVIPHKFVLPPSELEFQRLGCPGSFPRILESMVDAQAKAVPGATPDLSKSGKRDSVPTVTQMSHTIKSIPVSILAVYVHGSTHQGGTCFSTCDLEVSPHFMFEWEHHPDRAYSVPGAVMIKEFQDASDAHVRAAPPGSGDVGQRMRRRVVLKDVPISALKAVHSASFNIYDARFKTTDDALSVPPSQIKNDFNPRASSETSQFMGAAAEKRGGFCISAGPVPSDTLSCTYEWQLSLRANSEAEVYHFVTMLRQCVRMDFFQQALKMSEFKQRATKTGNMRYQVGVPLTTQSGYLEVVLIEARRLRPNRVQKFKDTKHMMEEKIVPELNPYVVFRLKNRGEPVHWDAAKHAPIKTGEVFRAAFDKWGGVQNAHGEDISVNLLNTNNDMALHFAAIFSNGQFMKIRLNDWRASRKDEKGQGWGRDASVNADSLPRNLFVYGEETQIDFEKSPIAWQISINKQHIPALDFPHRDNPPMDVLKVATYAGENAVPHTRELFLPRVDLVVRGSKIQQSPILNGTSSPNWSTLEQCQPTGGWLFKTPPIDPSAMPHLVMELEVKNHQIAGWPWPVGVTRVPVTGVVSPDVGAPKKNLCDAQRPFNNFWLPLCTPTDSGSLVPNPSGELHIMTRWVAGQQNQVQKRMPKTARKYFRDVLKPKLQSSSLREPIYDLNMRCAYNPNLAKDQHPLTRASLIGQHAEELFNAESYLECCERRQKVAWDQYIDKVRGEQVFPNLTAIRQGYVEALGDKSALWEIEENLRRGFPASYRLGAKKLWYGITNAHKCIPTEPTKRMEGYRKLLEKSTSFKSDAMLQLQEDLVTAVSWEASAYPNVVDAHLERLNRAKNVCSALITFSYDLPKLADWDCPNVNDAAKNKATDWQCPPTSCGIAYCESLLVIAFFMLLPQVPEGQEDKSEPQPGYTDNRGNQQIKKDQELEGESDVFWLLYTLISSPAYSKGSDGNGSLKAYFGAGEKEQSAAGASPPLATFEGASDDVAHLNSCLARYDRELWVHMTGLGFHLSSVFHGAFMRLFAFYMPTATVFRFWDLLFSESTRFHGESLASNLVDRSPKSKYPRHSLIDLAYGSLKICRTTLLRCESAREVRECIVSFLEALYDPSSMIEITTQTERELWEGPGTTIVGVEPEHLRDYDLNSSYYKKFLKQFLDQNTWLRVLTQEVLISSEGARGTTNQTNQGAAGAAGAQAQQAPVALQDTRMTTRNVVQHVTHPLRTVMMTQDEGKQFGGIFRKTSERICELGPQLDPSVFGSMKYILWTKLGQTVENFAQMSHHDQQRIAISVPPLPNTLGEPTQLTKNEWTRQISRVMGQSWNYSDCANKLYDEFESPSERRMSLNEFFIALVCCCKGTVGEKALALFHLHSYYTIPTKLNHLVPVLNHTKAVVEKVEGSQEREKGAAFAPPEKEDVPKTIALHFEIYTHTQGTEHMLGEAFVQNLQPYLWAGMDKDVPQPFTIWGTPMRLPPGMMVSQAMKGNPSQIRPYLGDMMLGLKWMPCGDAAKPNFGQIGVHIHSIRFDPNRVEAPKWKNPFVKVWTYNKEGTQIQIPRWDPRSHLRQIGNVVTAGIAYSGAFDKFLDFGETMRRDALGMLHHKWGTKNHGWKLDTKENKDGLWQWNEKWGDQYSTENFEFRKEFVGSAATVKSNTISIQACRQITLAILRRNLYMVSNRQAMLVADVAFNRAGMVPGILEAILVQGSQVSHDYATPTDLKVAYIKQGKHCHDVKHQIILELEKQTNSHMGSINLWDRRFGNSEKKNLSDLQINDPFTFSSKILWIRYCRAGDGERGQVQIPVDGQGYFQPKVVPMDMDPSDPSIQTDDSLKRATQAQMTLSKEEFVSCILANPMLSESLRQLSSRDFSTKNLPMWLPIKLSVTISDPAAQQEDDDLFDVLNVRQSVLLEVWDFDLGTKDDFLGECWMPPLGSIGNAPRQFVRTLTEASRDLGGTRPDPKKNIDLKKKVTGDITFWASWTLPADELPSEEDQSLEARVKREEMLHTGKLYIKIVKAEGLRVADYRRKNGSDPYACAYVKNDCYDSGDPLAWRQNELTGIHTPIFMTKSKKATISPEWNEQTDPPVKLQTGAFEKRTRKKKWEFHVTKRAKQKQTDDRNLAVVQDQDELKIDFGMEIDKQKHNVEIFMGDTVREFKIKLMDACKKVCANLERSGQQKDRDMAAKYKLVTMTFKHAITVFQPSERLRSLAQQRRDKSAEYSRLYHVEDNDPSSWQPLDPMCTFYHYSALHGFGPQATQRLRISEGTEDYKVRNHRYRAFEDARVENAKRIEERNLDQECFGFAAYTHKDDGGSREWRAVLAERPETQDGSYKVHWVYNPKFGASAAAVAAGADDIRYTVDEHDVLLAAMNPKILGSGNFEHQELLAQAPELFKSGKNEKEIAVILNTKLQQRFTQSQDANDSEPEDAAKAETKKETRAKTEAPPPISEQEVRHHLEVLRGEDRTDAGSTGVTPTNTPRGGADSPNASGDDSRGRPALGNAPSNFGGPSGPSGGGSAAPPSSSGGAMRGPGGPSMGGPPAGAMRGPGGPSVGGPPGGSGAMRGPGGPQIGGGPSGPSMSGPARTGPGMGSFGGGGGGPQRG